MKSICLYFQIHQPFRLKRYRFFDIGKDHYYYDDFANDDIITRIARNSYIPAVEAMTEMVRTSGGKFKVALSISGVALEQLEMYVPELIDSLKELAKTGCVEFLSETYAHSLSSLTDVEEFRAQVKAHDEKIYNLFGQQPKVFRNTELIFSDEIAGMISGLGFKGVITEGAKHILGWKSPNYLYNSMASPRLKMLLKNDKFSEDIARNFSNYEWSDYPLTAEKYISWIKGLPEEESIVNLFMNCEVLGESQPRETGIFEFFKALPRFAEDAGIGFILPSEAISKLKPVDALSVPYPMSWTDEARDVSTWLGNRLQNEAFHKLYDLSERVRMCEDRRIKQDWMYLQASDHFFYMSTKYGSGKSSFSPYDSPFDAFINYMNVLSDFIVRVEEQYPAQIENEELNSLLTTIRNQAGEIEMLEKELKSARAEKQSMHVTKAKAPAKTAKATKPAAKSTTKKSEATEE
ncbi:MAG TPA: glycoside hydrolase family 57 protein [Candidatus Barnesiella excrementipullorum]|uniref:Glycoside hydrolase family 57 protein n=1 Tax=Candidatus Barnesiella excrementipullorum TaxID=2838479 RepID=A0A9D2AQ53_9BACT|nr:glycoside hydrolase family 57 protein [Candidatus Barnesiella excrementipullorum]